ncbi:SPL family radical SAM protein [Bryobacter aggregatus]|uniref:SPL family radical SAM protein n=1 Tax=Bryobacter aggregatus TaxID=360054 RepID=UPI00068DDE6F|nr:radical SAM protein [Bryobacter aggregatus]
MQLVGIAKAAAVAPLLESKRTVTYSHLATGKWINRVSGERLPFQWSINPYRGCEMACQYCYARYTHEFMELREPEDFETRIFAKVWNASEFRRELARVPKSQAIAIGTATDPYQHAERRYEVMRQMLEVFANENGRKLWITTKSDLPARDAELLQRVAMRNVLYVNFTITTLDAELARGLEPKAPRPDLRLAAMKELTMLGVRCGAMASPVLPGINDQESALLAVAEQAKDAGAHWFGGGVLFLRSPTREVFFDYLRRKFPALAGRYEATYFANARPTAEYHQQIEEQFDRIRRATGLSRKATPYLPPDWEQGSQMSLAL